jgi:hypothetical protein
MDFSLKKALINGGRRGEGLCRIYYYDGSITMDWVMFACSRARAYSAISSERI